MIIHPAEQGTQEWKDARLGLPTASRFDSIITPKTRKPSSAATGYLNELLAEWLLGCPIEDFSSGLMQRGSEMEAEAVLWYELQRDLSAEPVGLCLRDDGRVGASPDRLVGQDGLLEIKCHAPKIHVAYLLGGPADEHRCQVQGQLWVTGRAWADLLCYHPEIPPVLIRVERDEEFIAALAAAADAFVARLDEARDRLRAQGCVSGLERRQQEAQEAAAEEERARQQFSASLAAAADPGAAERERRMAGLPTEGPVLTDDDSPF